jgi:selenide,water dikinase
VTLLSTTRFTAYSGMLPGLIAGHYTRRESHIDLAALCAACRVAFIEEQACDLELRARVVVGTTGARHDYDILSIDTGAVTRLEGILGAREHALPLKPVAHFLERLHALDEALGKNPRCTIAVVGGGAGGFEVVLALDYRLRRRFGAGGRPMLVIATDAPALLGEFRHGVRTLAESILRAQGIAIETAAETVAIDADGIRTSDGRRLAADHVVLATGAAASAIYKRSGLQTDARGFIAVTSALQSVSHPEVFACGDVAAVLAHPRPKAGVFAVRQGPPLTRNLRRALAGVKLLPFEPQQHYLALMSTGDKRAIATRNGWHLHGGWVWHWKDWIDRRFVARFDPASCRHDASSRQEKS